MTKGGEEVRDQGVAGVELQLFRGDDLRTGGRITHERRRSKRQNSAGGRCLRRAGTTQRVVSNAPRSFGVGLANFTSVTTRLSTRPLSQVIGISV
jgi:hypothetical protein